MRDIPVFTTQFGAASLFLKKIPYTGQAYVRLYDSREPEKLLKECVSFCCGAGAKEVYAAGSSALESYPLSSTIVSMSAGRTCIPETDARLIRVQAQTLERWRSLYHEKMLPVPNAAPMTAGDARKNMKKGICYFVYRGQTLLGIGVAEGNRVEAVASVAAGAGRDVLAALCGAVSGDRIHLTVAQDNVPAMKLYRRLGFRIDGVISRWYRVI